jgi:diguanylate cyclase (GGDEF)-like protein/PAS domain S-box-containing protein
MKRQDPPTEKALRLAKEEVARFKGAIEAADHAIYMTDPTPVITYVNAAFETLTGYSAKEAVGKNPNILQSGIQEDNYYERLWETIVDGRVWKEEITNRRKDGSLYQAYQIISPIRDDQGTVRNFVAIQHDITNSKEIEWQLRNALAEQSAIFENTQDALFLVDVIDEREFRYRKLNPTHEAMTGFSTKEVRGKRPEDILDENNAEGVLRRYRSCLQQRLPISYEETLDLPSGRKVWSTKLTPIIQEGRVVQLVGSAREITEQKALEAKLRELSDSDPLTGICNRRKSMEELDNELQRSLRYERPFSVLMVDLDRFKIINDRFGHSAGDVVLQRFVQTVQPILRSTDTFGRWGGEEFIIVLSETDRNGALRMAERVRKAVSTSELISGEQVSVSIGIASLPEGPKNRDELVNAADAALYRAKESGRNRVYTAL